ncbi:taperin-like isoform X2 [Papio anubis]|uniref:taperin-like isoform X2 n=1 Tax=Papio anubis TaxID=9555 RepID=UPI0012ADA64B|nr:taperin-like isoform X2 [Papio anubis]
MPGPAHAGAVGRRRRVLERAGWGWPRRGREPGLWGRRGSVASPGRSGNTSRAGPAPQAWSPHEPVSSVNPPPAVPARGHPSGGRGPGGRGLQGPDVPVVRVLNAGARGPVSSSSVLTPEPRAPGGSLQRPGAARVSGNVAPRADLRSDASARRADAPGPSPWPLSSSWLWPWPLSLKKRGATSPHPRAVLRAEPLGAYLQKRQLLSLKTDSEARRVRSLGPAAGLAGRANSEPRTHPQGAALARDPLGPRGGLSTSLALCPLPGWFCGGS